MRPPSNLNTSSFTSRLTAFTVATVTFGNGDSCLAIISIENNLPTASDGFNGQDWWSLERTKLGLWRPPNEGWMSAAERRPSFQRKDQNIFPLQVRSKLLFADGAHLSFSVH